MAKKEQLRSLRSGTIINITSKKQESEIIQALDDVILKLNQNYSLKFQHNKTWRLKDIANRLNKHFPKVPFFVRV